MKDPPFTSPNTFGPPLPRAGSSTSRSTTLSQYTPHQSLYGLVVVEMATWYERPGKSVKSSYRSSFPRPLVRPTFKRRKSKTLARGEGRGVASLSLRLTSPCEKRLVYSLHAFFHPTKSMSPMPISTFSALLGGPRWGGHRGMAWYEMPKQCFRSVAVFISENTQWGFWSTISTVSSAELCGVSGVTRNRDQISTTLANHIEVMATNQNAATC